MSNIKGFNFNKIDLRLSNRDYWDFYLATDENVSYLGGSGSGSGSGSASALGSGNCFVVWYDFENTLTYKNNNPNTGTLLSLVNWNNAINTGYTATTIGLTGIDNGLITFQKTSGDTSNLALLSALTASTLVITSGDTRLTMNLVTGTTGNYIYPRERIIDPIYGAYEQLCGGFFQGFYKIDGTNYKVLPTRVNDAWSAEFWLRPKQECSLTGVTGTTLNDVYPNNKGIFFYMGTRAENKFWNQFYGNSSGCTSGCTQDSGCTGTVNTWCTTIKENDISVLEENGFAIPLIPPQVKVEVIKNPFLIYGRAKDNREPTISGSVGTTLINTGQTTQQNSSTNCTCKLLSNDGLGSQTFCTYHGGGIAIKKTVEVMNNYQNPFLIYGRASGFSSSGCSCTSCCGPNDGLGSETKCSFSGRSKPQTVVDYKKDITDNALAFIITDDGKIGYRLLTVTGTCYTASTGERLYESNVTIKEEYSLPGLVSFDEWSYITIRYKTNYLTDCELVVKPQRFGQLMFYVNSRLIFVVDNFPEFIAKRLDEHYLKQVGVPFNFSLGGGSQGLIDSQTFDGLDMADRGLPIEKNFAGTFIGDISQFKFNICDLTYSDIQYNYVSSSSRYNTLDRNLILTEQAFFLLQQNGYGVEWI